MIVFTDIKNLVVYLMILYSSLLSYADPVGDPLMCCCSYLFTNDSILPDMSVSLIIPLSYKFVKLIKCKKFRATLVYWIAYTF